MSFRYTHPSSKFTIQQKEFYEDNGYILIKKNVSDHLIEELRQRFVEICNDPNIPHGVETLIKDQTLKAKGAQGEFVINKFQEFTTDPILWKYCSEKSVVDVVENITGPNIIVVHSMLINKPPDADPASSLHPLHQDLLYFPFRPADKIIASWTAMEYTDEKNGCLYVIPGSHKWGQLLTHEYPKGFKNKLYLGIQGLDHLPKKHVVMEKGDTLFFHPLLLHGSGPNYTKGFRKAISCHYADSDCTFIDVRGTPHERMAKEVEELYEEYNGPIGIVDIWRAKSRLVRGVPGNYQHLKELFCFEKYGCSEISLLFKTGNKQVFQ